jgi:NADH-quinone oxidoreductase subunit E
MLTPEETNEIETEMQHYPTRQAVCIDALKIVQKHRGWVSDESIRDIAGFLQMTADQLDGVATFYNLIFRKPVGRHVIFFCDSVSCWLMGSNQLRDELKARLGVPVGGTTDDRKFTLLPIVCLGACDHAPVAMVDDELHTDLTAERVAAMLERYP